MRDYVLLYINGRRLKIDDERAFLPLANFLRYEQSMAGTKIVCAEGDCGACTVLKGSISSEDSSEPMTYKPFNSCITPVFVLDGHHVVTIEGLEESSSKLDPVQQAFVDCNASQCGYCTPGFVMAMAGLFEEKSSPNKKDVQNYLTGNLCRCTGYDSIVQAGLRVDASRRQTIQQRYHRPAMVDDLRAHQKVPIELRAGNRTLEVPTTLRQAVQIRSKSEARLISAATDLGVQINKGRIAPKHYLSLSLVPQAHTLTETARSIEVGAQVNWERLRQFTKHKLPEFGRFLDLFASPQIKNVGTLIGNVANASPIADSTPYLMMAEAMVHITGIDGDRCVPMTAFYKGYKVLDLSKDEVIVKVSVPKPQPDEIIKLYKVSARRDLDISCVNAAISMTVDNARVTDIRIAYGGIGPVVKRFSMVEAFLRGKEVSKQSFAQAMDLVAQEVSPISDVRGSKSFRTRVAQNLLKRFYVDVMLEQKEAAK